MANIGGYEVNVLQSGNITIVMGRDVQAVHNIIAPAAKADCGLTSVYLKQFQFNTDQMLDAATRHGDKVAGIVVDLLQEGIIENISLQSSPTSAPQNVSGQTQGKGTKTP